MFRLDMREFLRIPIPGCVQRTTGCGSHSFSVPVGHGLGSEVFSKLSDSGIYGINAVFMLARSPPPQGREGRGANGSVGGAPPSCRAGRARARAHARRGGGRGVRVRVPPVCGSHKMAAGGRAARAGGAGP